MGRLDSSCQLPWTLLAGIGRIESDHGRYGGVVLGSTGVSRPHIIGVPLNGAGPMQLIQPNSPVPPRRTSPATETQRTPIPRSSPPWRHPARRDVHGEEWTAVVYLINGKGYRNQDGSFS